MSTHDPNNFTFEIETISYQIVHGALTTIDSMTGAETTWHHTEPGDEVYLLARGYAELLLKVE